MPPIPDDIMQAAMEAYLSLMDDDLYDDHKYGSEHIARAIMAERERAAKVAESFAAPKGVPQIDYDIACTDIANAIRKGTKP